MIELLNLDYLFIFFQLNLLEVLPCLFFYRHLKAPLHVILVVTLCNSVTHPLVFFGFMQSGYGYLFTVILAELFAIGTETILHERALGVSWSMAMSASAVANMISWQMAPVLTYFIFF